MSNQFGFLSDDTFAEKMDTMNQFLAAIATGQGGSLKPTSWSDVQALVRKGLWQVCSITPVKRKTVLWSQEQDGRVCVVSALLF